MWGLLICLFLDALASLELVISVGGQFFREIFSTGFWDTDLSILKPYNITTLQPYDLTTLQPYKTKRQKDKRTKGQKDNKDNKDNKTKGRPHL